MYCVSSLLGLCTALGKCKEWKEERSQSLFQSFTLGLCLQLWGAAATGTAELWPIQFINLPFSAVHSGQNGHKKWGSCEEGQRNHPVKPLLFSVSILHSEIWFCAFLRSAFSWFFFLVPWAASWISEVRLFLQTFPPLLLNLTGCLNWLFTFLPTFIHSFTPSFLPTGFFPSSFCSKLHRRKMPSENLIVSVMLAENSQFIPSRHHSWSVCVGTSVSSQVLRVFEQSQFCFLPQFQFPQLGLSDMFSSREC